MNEERLLDIFLQNEESSPSKNYEWYDAQTIFLLSRQY